MRIILSNVIMLFKKVFGNYLYRTNNKWVFGEWFGERCCDNSMYLANYISKNHPDVECVWISKESADLSRLDKKIKVIKYGTGEANKTLLNASAVFVNQGFVDVSDKRNFILSGPITINLWHGVPWKKIGLDASKSNSKLINCYYKFRNWLLSCNLFVSLSDNMTQILQKAYGVKKENIINVGYPRNSIFYKKEITSSIRCNILEELKKRKCNVNENVKIITYMPTFRDSKEENYSFSNLSGNEEFEELLEKNNVIIIEKSHYAAPKSYGNNYNNRIIRMDNFPAQEMLAASDILITDYSSCFFDFLILDRPIIHFIYDYDSYSTKDRGLYYDKEKVVCGAIASNEEDLVTCIKKYLLNPNLDNDLRQKRKKEFILYETSDSCELIFKYIKKKILIKEKKK